MSHQYHNVHQSDEQYDSVLDSITGRSPNDECSIIVSTDPSKILVDPDEIPLPAPLVSPVNGRGGLFSGGWRTGCTYFAIVTAVVFLLNLTFTIYSLSVYGYNAEEGTGSLFDGSCKRVDTLNLVSHLFINTLSTVLLSASNYTTQCLTAPTRKEIDKAHREKRWVDIGVVSIANLRRLRGVKLFIGCILAISSVPLHLLYNSAIVSTITHRDYTVWVMGNETIHMNTTNFVTLGRKECIEQYGKEFVSDTKDVVLVIPGNWPLDPTQPGNTQSGSTNHFDWICEVYSGDRYVDCDVSIDPDTWKINGTDIQYCLTQPVEGGCLLQYNLIIMVAVLVCNALKFQCILFAVFAFRKGGDPLITIGDAVDSFLTTPDETTEMMCIMTQQDIKAGVWKYIGGETQRSWEPHKVRWFCAASTGRWIVCCILSIVTIISALLMFISGYKDLPGPPSESRSFVWGLKPGTLDTRLLTDALVPTQNKLLASVVTANLPQLVFSFIYLLYNGLFTCMLLAKEWDQFSYNYRPLRVTTPSSHSLPAKKCGFLPVTVSSFLRKLTPARPSEEQGSSYFLQLPYRYSLPLMVVGGTIHWAISQSLFVVRVAVMENSADWLGAPSLNGINPETNVGWSPVGAVIGIACSVLLLIVTLGCGLQKYQGDIPLVGSCSAAISAACHPDPSVATIASKRVQWGVVWKNPDGIGHCSFTDNEILEPLSAQIYTGGIPQAIDSTGIAGMRGRVRYACEDGC